MLWFSTVVFFLFAVLIKKTLLGHIDTIELINYKNPIILFLGGILIIAVVSVLNKYGDKIVQSLNARLTPLVWIFGFMFVIAVPLSFMKQGFFEAHASVESDTSTHALNHGDKANKLAPLKTKERLPNIILIVMDALTAQDMHLFGYERQTTPFITEWAKNAVVFNRAYASSNWTTPATMSLMTGQRVWTHRVWHQAIFHPVRDYQDNLPSVLSKYGYDVYGFVQNRYAHPETLGIKNAFSLVDNQEIFKIQSSWWFDHISDLFASRPVVRRWIFKENRFAKLIDSYEPDLLQTKYPPELVYNRFLDAISKRFQHQDSTQEKSFFAWLHLLPPHQPYLPDKTHIGRFGNGEEFNTAHKQHEIGSFHRTYDSAKQEKIDIIRKRYDEFILYSDEQFKLFLDRLSEIIDMSNTIVILSSDHGESFTHNFLGHSGPHLFEPLVHIPLIVRLPGERLSGPIDVPVEQIDVAPTILELAGLPIPDWMEGRSLVPFFELNQGISHPVYSMQLDKNRSIGEPITKATIAVWEGDYKLIYYTKDSKTMLFNLRSDSKENHDISDENPKIVQRLLNLIRDDLSLANKKILKSLDSKYISAY